MLPIELGDLKLRRMEYEDRQDLFDIYSRTEVTQYELFGPLDMEAVDAMLYEQSNIFAGDPGVPLRLVAEYLPETRVIGSCMLMTTDIDARQGEIGFTFHPEYGGRGFATRTVTATLGFGFTMLGLHRVVGTVDTRNEPSWKLMERVGMRREAHFIHDVFADDEWIDDYVYAMLEHEWRDLQAKSS